MKCSNCKKETNVTCICGYCPDCIAIKHPETKFHEVREGFEKFLKEQGKEKKIISREEYNRKQKEYYHKKKNLILTQMKGGKIEKMKIEISPREAYFIEVPETISREDFASFVGKLVKVANLFGINGEEVAEVKNESKKAKWKDLKEKKQRAPRVKIDKETLDKIRAAEISGNKAKRDNALQSNGISLKSYHSNKKNWLVKFGDIANKVQPAQVSKPSIY